MANGQEVKPTLEQLRNIRQSKQDIIANRTELQKLLAAGGNPDTIKSLEKDMDEQIAKIDQFLKVYDNGG